MAQLTGTASGHTKPHALPVAQVRDVSIRRGVVQVCDFAPLTQLTLKEMIEPNNLNRWSNLLKSDRSNLPGLNCWIPSCWVWDPSLRSAHVECIYRKQESDRWKR